jgi:glycosyltransferase involved in cell wall biosynthesis
VIEEGRFGGPQARITHVAPPLRALGIETTVLLPKADSGAFRKALSESGTPFVPLPLHRLSKDKRDLAAYLLYFPLEVLALYRTLRRLRPDVVHCNGAHQVKGAIAARLASIPVVWHLNDTYGLGPIKKLFGAVARRCASGFIVASRKVYETYLAGTAFTELPCTEIHAPVDMHRFDPDTAAANPRISAHPGVKILNIANINPIKGHEYLVDAAALINRDSAGVGFFIGGLALESQLGYYRGIKARMEAQGVGNLAFLGPLDNVPGALKAADIFILTSIAEASPTAVWEAMAMGKAVVSTDVGSVSQYIEHGVSGFVVPPRDPRAMAECVGLLIRDPGLRESMGRAAMSMARERLSLERAAALHADVYRRIAIERT